MLFDGPEIGDVLYLISISSASLCNRIHLSAVPEVTDLRPTYTQISRYFSKDNSHTICHSADQSIDSVEGNRDKLCFCVATTDSLFKTRCAVKMYSRLESCYLHSKKCNCGQREGVET